MATAFRLAHGAIEPVHRDEGQAVGADEAAHLLDIHLVGQQIVGVGRVHAIEAGMGGGRRGHAEMHLGGAGIAHHRHDLLEVVPRTMESSTSTTRLPWSMARLGLCFSLTPRWRMESDGSMKVRPT